MPLAPLTVLSVASEVFPLIKTGGLADVAGALPGALAAEGVLVRTLVPGYPTIMRAVGEAQVVASYPDLMGGPARVLATESQGLALFVIDAPHLYERTGNPYMDSSGDDWEDNVLRFAALGRVAADIGQGRVESFVPDVVHAHDWQAGLAPAYLHYDKDRRPLTVMTVHNLAFQGRFGAEHFASLGLPATAFAMDGVEYYGGVGFLKAGLALADRITTVSPTYAAEIRTPAGGMGLDGLLRMRSRVVFGILNGIDTSVWDPAQDPMLARPFDARHLKNRALNRTALEERLRLSPGAGGPLFGVVSRLTWQKGMDLLLAAMPELLARGGRLALLGSGDLAIEQGFLALAAANPGQVAVVTGYNEALAHEIQAGVDALLVPSRFEPCGLTQLCALRYGAIPVVARTGGLADTVVDANQAALASRAGTGIVFSPVTTEALSHAIERTVQLHANPVRWRAVQMRAMRQDVSWAGPAAQYARLYRDALAS